MDHTGLEHWQEDRNDPSWKHSAESEPVNSKKRAKERVFIGHRYMNYNIYTCINLQVHREVEISVAFRIGPTFFKYQFLGFSFRVGWSGNAGEYFQNT